MIIVLATLKQIIPPSRVILTQGRQKPEDPARVSLSAYILRNIEALRFGSAFGRWAAGRRVAGCQESKAFVILVLRIK